MFENFENIPAEKKKKIIDVAIEEFVEQGYKKGSTNNIVKKAGISKGILFHYFGSKKNLYIYLLKHVLGYYILSFDNYLEEPVSKDIFERIKSWQLVKLKMFSKTPMMYEFIVKAFLTVPDEIQKEIEAIYKSEHGITYGQYLQKVFEDIDTSRFRQDLNVSKAIGVLMLSMEAIIKKYIEAYRGREHEILDDMDKIYEEIDQVIDIFKWGFYK